MSRWMVLLLAATSGVAVGNIYFPQAIVPLIARGLHVPTDAAALVVTAVQVGYAAGIFLLVPLGDRFRNGPLVVILLSATGLGLLTASAAPSLPPLLGASALIGLVTVVGPLVGSMAAGLVTEERRGAVSGTLLSGALGGMLISRTVSGMLGEWLTWRAPYLLAAVLSLLSAALLTRALPVTTPGSDARYRVLISQPLRLLRREPALRRSCLYQATVFAGFSAVWSTVALLLTGPAYQLSTPTVGLLALVNAGTMLCTPVAGRQVDRRGSDVVNSVCMLAVIGASIILALGSIGGVLGMVWLTLGTLLLDVGMQCGMVANQVRFYALGSEARSRRTTAYMTCAYAGGSLGSWWGVLAYSHLGWLGVCSLVALLATAAWARHMSAIVAGALPGRRADGRG